jgi:SAM-dependent methyltransferase
MDPLAGSSWSAPSTVSGFVRSSPNETLLAFARRELERVRAGADGLRPARSDAAGRLIDLGCGAGRNAIPLARGGWTVLGTDLSQPMLCAARRRIEDERLGGRACVALAPMDRLPAATGSADLVVAHGIWNLARSTAEWRRALAEAARVARPGAGLFVFTFSRNTLPADAEPVPGEAFVFTQFSGEPQCFLTADELLAELLSVGFAPDSAVPLTEHNRRRPGALHAGGPPVIYEAAFRRSAR